MKNVKKLINNSEETITIHHPDGVDTLLPSGQFLENFQILNLDEIKSKVSVTMNLGEINERTGKQILLD